jgi:uncharacterized protein
MRIMRLSCTVVSPASGPQPRGAGFGKVCVLTPGSRFSGGPTGLGAALLRLLLALFALAGGGAALAQVSEAPIKVVYHISDGSAQAARGLVNIQNHLNAAPETRITVVTHGPGIDFLLEGATDPQGHAFTSAIGALAARGVEFLVCNNTLVGRGIPADKVVLEARVVPSGVAEVARLQAREGYVYIRP